VEEVRLRSHLPARFEGAKHHRIAALIGSSGLLVVGRLATQVRERGTVGKLPSVTQVQMWNLPPGQLQLRTARMNDRQNIRYRIVTASK